VYELTREDPDDKWEVEALYDLCFAPGRRRCPPTACATGCLRCATSASWRATISGFSAGAIRFWPVRVGRHEALLLGPVAVHPTRQGEGLGGR
jgi:predicted N-acetyltransferase YhbS